jgi:uncharacterized membrane protein
VAGTTLRDHARGTARFVVLGGSLLWPLSGMAQQEVAPAAAPASITHVIAKTVTQQLAAGSVIMTIFSLGTGSLVGGGVLTVGLIAVASVWYPANEFLWDYYSPNTNLRVNNEAFNTSSSLWRTTWKYLTFTTSTTTARVATIYAYTGSVYSTATMASATLLIMPLVFYANDTAWDWYDWYSSAATSSK